ncbi:MAG: prepilin peptidase [Pseudomonas sp.]|uniref:A24 family peptidase n=1 Tax=Pseudomonas sp. TaxID=306 RepID=UPI0027330994|nr:prepilin peptidase [Pseudomonas sp.]MDP3848073.1 prepilin peptidase [Pseudomonas sp.]
MDIILSTSVFIFLGIAVLTDLSAHRISNVLVLAGLASAIVIQSWVSGFSGVTVWLTGLIVGFLIFLPFYAFAGMAAGDVKLMAMVGSFLGPASVLWAAAFSLMAGSVLGVLVLLYKKQLFRFLQRCWAMASLRAYIDPAADDAARQRFPYAIAILFGSLISVYFNLASVGG